jgi:hypothetical protein
MFLAALCAAIMQVLAKREHERSDRVVKGCVSDMAGHGGQSGKGPELPVHLVKLGSGPKVYIKK